jgi:hypothetical protein
VKFIIILALLALPIAAGAADPVKVKMQERSWIHTADKDPVRYKMQKRSRIHGSIHDKKRVR